MNKVKQVLSCFYNNVWLIILSLASFPFSASASTKIHTLPTYSFAEFNTAFILGLSLPLLLIVALLKPILMIKWRYPAILTFSLLFQFYAFSYLTQWQTSALLISAAIFLLTAYLWLQSDFKQHALTKALQWVMAISCFSFIGAVVVMREVDVFQLWLVYLAVLLIASSTAIIKSQLNKNIKLRTLSLCIATASFAGALYLWLNVQISIVWVISFSVLSYLLAIINGCWGVVEAIKNKLSDIEAEYNLNKKVVEKVSVPLDPITNLPTYQQSLISFKQTIKNNPDSSFVAIVFKPLNFYQVNKVLGHQNSDILLLQLAYNLQKSVSDEHLLVNFNNEESPVRISRLQGLDFLVVLDASLSNHPVKTIVKDICQKLVKSVPQAMSFKSFSLNFELAFGASISDLNMQEAEQFIAQASDALLEGERQNQLLCYFNPQSAIYTERQLSKMEKLKQDITNEKITWLVQPQISLSNKRLKGFELSIEWQGSDGVSLSQNEFNEIAEFSGEIYQLTKQMIKQAFHVLSIMHNANIKESVAINLSSKDLLEAELIDYIEKQAERAGVPVDYLVVELNEQVLLDSAFRARMMVDQLKALGIKIAIDNFSGSYESLRYLRRTAIQQVKIDCALLNDEQNSASEKTIVNALINLIRKMDIPVVAVGINNKKIEESYMAIGGDLAQGNLIHQGIDIKEVSTWLSQWQKKTRLG
ncbi:MAG: EAL domain-containing protein [Colwelliaceae bacterium]|nr:EAL domain-containing protein [Colwelliaceae bacterium]